jgi:hypothetical protein
MIDYLFAAPDQATAQADPALAAYWLPANPPFTPGGWRGDCVNPGLQVWSEAQDTTQTITDPVMGTQTITTHNYLPGLWLNIATNTRSPALEASPLLVLGADRDAANAGAPQTAYVFAFGPGQSLARFAGMHVSPMFAGANYPFG